MVDSTHRLFAGDAAVLLYIFLASGVMALPAQPPPWEEIHEKLQHQRDVIYAQLNEAHSTLVQYVQQKNPDLLKRLSMDPPTPRETGYGLLPVIEENSPVVTIEPKQTVYSLLRLQGRLSEELEIAAKLADKLPDATNIEALVVDFERSLEKLRNLENHLTYHRQWQNAIVQYAGYFHKNNQLVAFAREMNRLILKKESPHRVEELRRQIVQGVAPFKPTRGLVLLTTEGGEVVLPVTVCTDIEDQVFLQAFKEGVQQAYSHSAAAAAHRFAVDLNWRLLGADILYPDGPPNRGASIDIKTHRSLFADCPLVLTTGAASTNALVGNRIVLGTDPTSRRTLAHEFGHLLGFSDAYLRGYDGDPGDPYGVILVEWTGLTDDLMGSPGNGRISDEMIETLMTAYPAPVTGLPLSMPVTALETGQAIDFGQGSVVGVCFEQ